MNIADRFEALREDLSLNASVRRDLAGCGQHEVIRRWGSALPGLAVLVIWLCAVGGAMAQPGGLSSGLSGQPTAIKQPNDAEENPATVASKPDATKETTPDDETREDAPQEPGEAKHTDKPSAEPNQSEPELELRTQSIELNFINWEDNPVLDKLPRVRGAIIPAMKDIKRLIGHDSKSSLALLATLDLKLNAELWRLGYDDYEVILYPRTIPIPNVPAKMANGPQLRQEVSRLKADFTLLQIRLSPAHLEHLKQRGELLLSIRDLHPLAELKYWVLVDSGNLELQIRLITEKDDSRQLPLVNLPLGSDTDEKRDVHEPSTSGDSSSSEAEGDRQADDEVSKDDVRNGEEEPDDEQPDDKQSNESGGMKTGAEEASVASNDRATDRADTPRSDEEIFGTHRNGTNNESEHQLSNPALQTAPQISLSSPAGNWLAQSGIRNTPSQKVAGLWIDQQNGDKVWFDSRDAKLVVRAADNPGARSVIAKRGDGDLFHGQAYTVPKNAGCLGVGYWQPAALRVSNGHAQGEWKGKTVDRTTCELGDAPDGGPLRYRRAVLTRFVPLANGKYIHLVASPTAGAQLAQFRASAKITFDVSGWSVASIQVLSNGQQLDHEERGVTFDFITGRSGRHDLTALFLSADGRTLHQEQIRIDIPGVPGITN